MIPMVNRLLPKAAKKFRTIKESSLLPPGGLVVRICTYLSVWVQYVVISCNEANESQLL